MSASGAGGQRPANIIRDLGAETLGDLAGLVLDPEAVDDALEQPEGG